MLQLAIICPGDTLAQELFRHLPKVPDVEFTAVLRKYPTPAELLDMIRQRGAQALLLSADDLSTAQALAAVIDQHIPGFPVITASASPDSSVLAKFMQVGVRDHLVSPVDLGDLIQAIDSARRRLKVAAESEMSITRRAELVSFFPARAGVGATTIATSVSCILSEQMNTRTLLMDCDLAAGVLPFLLRVNRCASILEAAEHAELLDGPTLGQMAGRWNNLELLGAGNLGSQTSVHASGLDHLIEVALGRYEIVCADLPGALDSVSEPILRASNRIFLVTTNEIASLHMAAVRVRQLTERGLRERIRLVFSRKVNRNKMREREVQEAAGLPVSFALANDYAAVQTAILDATPMSIKGELGQGLQTLAKSLAVAQQKDASPKRKFLEFFSVPNGAQSGNGWAR